MSFEAFCLLGRRWRGVTPAKFLRVINEWLGWQRGQAWYSMYWVQGMEGTLPVESQKLSYLKVLLLRWPRAQWREADAQVSRCHRIKVRIASPS